MRTRISPTKNSQKALRTRATVTYAFWRIWHRGAAGEGATTPRVYKSQFIPSPVNKVRSLFSLVCARADTETTVSSRVRFLPVYVTCLLVWCNIVCSVVVCFGFVYVVTHFVRAMLSRMNFEMGTYFRCVTYRYANINCLPVFCYLVVQN